MKIYKKVLVKSILLILACFSLCYWVGTWNFAIIKSNLLLHEDYVFDMTGSKWKCESHNLEAVVTCSSIGGCMIVKDLTTDSKYILLSRGSISGEIYTYTKKLTLDDVPLCENIDVISKKRWGKLYKFIIKGVNKDCWYESGNDSISFELVEEYTSEWWDERQKSLRSE